MRRWCALVLAAAALSFPSPTLAGSPTWIPVAERAAADPGWAALGARLGPEALGAERGTSRWWIGRHDVGRPVGTDPASVALARALIEPLAEAFGVSDASELRCDRATSVPGAHDHEIVGLRFAQTWQGYEVWTPAGRAGVQLVFNGTLGRLAALIGETVPGLSVDVEHPLPIETVVPVALARVPAFDPKADRVTGTRTIVWVRAAEERTRADLVHEVRVQTAAPPHLWVAVLDARSGALLEWRDELRNADVTGTVAAGTWDDEPQSGRFTIRPMRALTVGLSALGCGAQSLTDDAGAFRLSMPDTCGVTPFLVTGRFAGAWATVADQSGNGDLAFSLPATPGVPLPIVLNPAPGSEAETAEATAYRFVTATRFFLKARLPGFEALQGLPVNVNVAGTCNAFWNGTSVNFFRSGGGCPNSAFEEIVAHEYGHAFHAWFHGSATPGGFSEGIGDHLGLYLSSRDDNGYALPTNREFGRSFFAPGQPGRDYRPGGGANQVEWPCPSCPVHHAGGIWAGFTLDLRDRLTASLGLEAGADLAESLTIAQYARDPSDMDAAVLGCFLQDDDDGNLANGTPHFADLAFAADRHLLPRPPDPEFVTFSCAPLAWTLGTDHPHELRAVVTGRFSPVAAVEVEHRVNGGAPAVTAMSPTGAPNEFHAWLPAGARGTRIDYRLRGRDAAGRAGTGPWWTFVVARPAAPWREDFETGAPGWSVTGTATRGQWECADPDGTALGTTAVQPEDDASPAPGTRCFVTGPRRGSGPDAQDLDGGPVHAVSPAWDLTGSAASWLTFSYWFQVVSVLDDALSAEVSVGGGPWTPAWTTTRGEPGWRTATIALHDVVPLTGPVRMRFLVTDAPNNSITEALVDEVLVTRADVADALTVSSPTPVLGGPVTFHLAAPGLAGASWLLLISLATGPVHLPPLGTLDLGPAFQPLATGQLGPSGTAAFGMTLPGDPGLDLVRVHAQAVFMGGPGLISNRVDLTLRRP